METVKVKLAGQEYVVEPLTFKLSKEWRESLGKPIIDLVNVLANADKFQLDNLADLVELVNLAKGILINSPDLVLDGLCAYSPILANDREIIEEKAYDWEIFDALLEVLKLAYPFGRLVKMFRSGSG